MTPTLAGRADRAVGGRGGTSPPVPPTGYDVVPCPARRDHGETSPAAASVRIRRPTTRPVVDQRWCRDGSDSGGRRRPERPASPPWAAPRALRRRQRPTTGRRR